MQSNSKTCKQNNKQKTEPCSVFYLLESLGSISLHHYTTQLYNYNYTTKITTLERFNLSRVVENVV